MHGGDMKARTKTHWQLLARTLGANIELILASLSVDKALPSLNPFERFELSIPSDDRGRRELDRATGALLAGESVRSYSAGVRWQLLWRLQSVQHVFRWYSKQLPRKTDSLARFFNSMDDHALVRCLLLDSSVVFFACMGAAHAHLLDDICCSPGLLKLCKKGKEAIPLYPLG